MRWSHVWIVVCACKGEPAKKAPKQEGVAPSGPRRFPEVDAAIDAMRPALLLAEPTETVSACKGPLEVVAIDHEAALLIAAGRPAPQGVKFAVAASDALVRYASKSPLSQDDVTAIEVWARARPAGSLWGFLDGVLVDGKYEGVLHVIDAKSRAVLCHTQFAAASSAPLFVSEALGHKLALLRAGTDVVVVPDPLTDNRGPALESARIPTATKKGSVCLTYRDVATEKDEFACHPTMTSCMQQRVALKSERKNIEVSACTEVGTKP